MQLHCEEEARSAISEEARAPRVMAAAPAVPPIMAEERIKSSSSSNNNNNNEYDVNLSLRDRVNLAVRKTIEDNHHQQPAPAPGVVR